MRASTRRFALAGAGVVWCALVGGGLLELFAYATTKGQTATTPDRWPDDSKLARGNDVTIVMFVHPECPCSRASLAELAAIEIGPTTTLDVVLEGPDEGGVWDATGRVLGAHRIVDDGREAARFGALTSGYTVVFDKAGVRRFAGGITGSRGHAGDNVGRHAVQRIVAGASEGIDAHPVFGCPLGDAR